MAADSAGFDPRSDSPTRRPPTRRVDLREAWNGIRALIRDPDDTGQVFRVIQALAGNSLERGFQRFRRGDAGRRILREGRSLATTLSDRAYLESLPEGSLGRAYADFTRAEEITPEGLIDASESVPAAELDPDFALYGARLRDMHDLWHVVTGYGRDLVGEAALLAFTYRQTRNRGIGFIITVAYLRAGRRGMPQQRRLMRDGFRRSGRAAWLPGADWEALLERPLDEVRQQLRVEAVGAYKGVRSVGAPAIA